MSEMSFLVSFVEVVLRCQVWARPLLFFFLCDQILLPHFTVLQDWSLFSYMLEGSDFGN
jgi:hypothetical protein